MERIKLEVSVRNRLGKEAVKKIRRSGFMPAIVYDRNINVPIEISHSNLRPLRSIRFSESTIIDMEIADGEKIEIVDSLGRSKGEVTRHEPKKGQNIRLTLDFELQQKAEELLEGREGAVVILDARMARYLHWPAILILIPIDLSIVLHRRNGLIWSTALSSLWRIELFEACILQDHYSSLRWP